MRVIFTASSTDSSSESEALISLVKSLLCERAARSNMEISSSPSIPFGGIQAGNLTMIELDQVKLQCIQILFLNWIFTGGISDYEASTCISEYYPPQYTDHPGDSFQPASVRHCVILRCSFNECLRISDTKYSVLYYLSGSIYCTKVN